MDRRLRSAERVGVYEAWAPVRPRPKGNSAQRARNGQRAFLVPSKVAKRTQRALVPLLAAAPGRPGTPLAGPVWRDAVYVLPIAASWPKWKREAALAGRLPVASGSYGDVGNLDKLLDDALEAAGWVVDDGLIVGGTTVRAFGEAAGYSVRLTALTQDPARPDLLAAHWGAHPCPPGLPLPPRA